MATSWASIVLSGCCLETEVSKQLYYISLFKECPAVFGHGFFELSHHPFLTWAKIRVLHHNETAMCVIMTHADAGQAPSSLSLYRIYDFYSMINWKQLLHPAACPLGSVRHMLICVRP
jgi:hypothetical protein